MQMKINVSITKWFRFLSLFVCLWLLANCGGGGSSTGSTTSTPNNVQVGGAIQGIPLVLTSTTSTIAGTPCTADGIGTGATFRGLIDVTSDGTNLYIVDSALGTVRKMVISTGEVSTLAGSAGNIGSTDGVGTAARFSNPRGITTDGVNLYVTDAYSTIRKIVISSGTVTTLAGTPGSYGSTDGPGTSAKFYGPMGITTDGTNLYIADWSNNKIRKIVISTGIVTTLAGGGYVDPGPFSDKSGDGLGTAAEFNGPQGITTDGINLYVTDGIKNTIRKIVISSAIVTTIAGTPYSFGTTDGIGPLARFTSPSGITTDGSNLYVSDYALIRKIVISTGDVTTVAGSSGTLGSADGTGASATFNDPQGVFSDGTNLYIAECGSNKIRKIVISSTVVSTIAGGAESADGNGPSARFSYPIGVTTDGTRLYVTDSRNNTIRQIVIASGLVTTIAGTPGAYGSDDGTGPSARFSFPTGITTDGASLYVTDSGNNTIRKIVISSGLVTTVAGTPGTSGTTDAIGAAARFSFPTGITTDGINLYVANSDGNAIRKVSISTGVVTTLAGGAWGSDNGVGTAASFEIPTGITTDGIYLYVADTGNNAIRKIDISSGVVTTLANNVRTSGPVAYGFGETAASYIRTFTPLPMLFGVTTDGSNLYVVDEYTIKKVAISSGAITTLTGTTSTYGSSDGTSDSTNFFIPYGITSDGKNLYVADTSNGTIRKIR